MSRQDRSGPPRDFTTVGAFSEPPFAVLPEPRVSFARRAARLGMLAKDHPLGPYLAFLSRLAAVQAQGAAQLPKPALDDAHWRRAVAHGMPAFASDLLAEGEDFARTFDWLLNHAEVDDAPEAARAALDRLRVLPWPERLALARSVFDAAYPAERIAECLYVAAALQLHLSRLAAQLDAESLRPLGDGICPVCGQLPVASMVVSRGAAERARYCCCGLCGSEWHAVRVKCTICGSTEKVSLRLIKEQSEDVAVEICGSCHSYVKHFRQDRAPELEPFVDDIASFGLDLLVADEGYVRPAANPFLIIGGSTPSRELREEAAPSAGV
ncbi:MAG TPA: formate dehydrogenase accessory protein FdhE [Rhodoblastus sp.]|nr:formate dehydrogenase accessory protein FdhE [Rhodoblastus sp.]